MAHMHVRPESGKVVEKKRKTENDINKKNTILNKACRCEFIIAHYLLNIYVAVVSFRCCSVFGTKGFANARHRPAARLSTRKETKDIKAVPALLLSSFVATISIVSRRRHCAFDFRFRLARLCRARSRQRILETERDSSVFAYLISSRASDAYGNPICADPKARERATEGSSKKPRTKVTSC